MNKGKICPSRAVLKFTIDMIRGKNCLFYIHDNLDPIRFDSIPCTVRPLNESIDVASQLISYRMVEIASNFKRIDKIDVEKRIRRQCDEPLLIPSTDITSYDDFKMLYQNKKAVIPPLRSTDFVEDDRKFQVFDHPSNVKAPRENKKENITLKAPIECKPHPIVDQIIKHFHLLKPNEPVFYCEPLYIIDPITILVVPTSTTPIEIDVSTKPTRNPLLPGMKPFDFT